MILDHYISALYRCKGFTEHARIGLGLLGFSFLVHAQSPKDFMPRLIEKPKVIVALRYDDFSATSPIEIENAIRKMALRHKVPMTFGVIPNVTLGKARDVGDGPTESLSEAKQEWLRESVKQGWLEVALHGLNHRSVRVPQPSEFAGLSAEKQHEIIKQGKDSLNAWGLQATTFIPPWNSYDEATLMALSKNGFNMLSADALGEIINPSVTSPIRYLPSTCVLPDLPKAVRTALRTVSEYSSEQIAKQGPLVVVAYFHPYDFLESNPHRGVISLPQFDRLLGGLSKAREAGALEVLTMGSLTDLPATAPAVYAAYSQSARRIPEPLWRWGSVFYRVYPIRTSPWPLATWVFFSMSLIGILIGLFALLNKVLRGKKT